MDSSSSSTCEETTRSDNVTVPMVAEDPIQLEHETTAKELAAAPPAMGRKARKAAERKARQAAAMKAKEAAEARKTKEAAAARKAEEEWEVEVDKDTSDWNAYKARLYRQFWIQCFSDEHGNYEDTTSIPAMRFTDGAASSVFAFPQHSLQIFSVKVKEINGDDLRCPLDVYGVVAVRDAVDHNRNIIFSRTRDDPQTVTAEEPFLYLTGPTRGVVVVAPHPNYFEFVLTAKGGGELDDDKELSFMTIPCMFDSPGKIAEARKLSTVELRFGHVRNSVEATIGMEVTGGSWPRGFEAVFIAGTASAYKEVLLLASGDDKLPVDDDGKVKLSRRVVSVEIDGELTVSVGVFDLDGKKDAVRVNQVFTPKEAGRSWKMLKVASCEMKVTVAWSLMSFVK